MKKARRLAVFFGILSLCIILFIFENSLQSRVESSLRSGYFVRLLLPLLERIPWIPRSAYTRVVRKAAHFTEFFALGFSLTGLSFTAPLKGRALRGLLPAALSLAAAAADEAIQLLSDRSGAVKDALLDFCGALCGILAARLCRRIRRLCRRKRGTAGQENQHAGEYHYE